MIKKTLVLSFVIALTLGALSACGVKGDLTYPGGEDTHSNVIKMKNKKQPKNWVK